MDCDSIVKYLTFEPYDYQLSDVKNMIYAEKNGNGGINCNPTGTGKTIEFVLLVFSDLLSDSTHKTLFISPNMRLIQQVKKEIQKINSPVPMKVCECLKSNEEIQKDCNIILTTKKILIVNNFISDVEWYRVIFDEAHHIKNDTSVTRERLKALSFKKLWLVTATPDLNGYFDYKSLLKIFGRRKVFIIRNNKNAIFDRLEIPMLTERIIQIKLSEIEVKIYQRLLVSLKNAFDSDRVIWLIAVCLLRRFCDGTGINFALNSLLENLISKCPKCEKQKNCLFFRCCRAIICFKCVKRNEEDLVFLCPNCLNRVSYIELFLHNNQREPISELLEQNKKPTKINALMEYLSRIRSRKVIVFTEWSRVASMVEETLKKEQQKYKNIFRIDGKVREKHRVLILDEFKNNPEPSILVMTLKTGGEGLNIVESNHVVILEPYWNYKTEQQAIDRVYRIGQTKNTYAARFYIQGTIEELLHEVQKEKLKDTNSKRVKTIINFSQLMGIFRRRYIQK
jgi:SNF2 family DNA or RNA helicase